jgi:8-oxo-dGTP diphosphatase
MIYVTCAIIRNNQGKVLVTQRSETMDLPNKWEFPGGKVRDGEDELSCIKREIKEELNITIEPREKLNNSVHDYGSKEICLIPFVCKYQSGEIKLHEHKSYTWLDINDLKTLDWCEADVPIVKQYVEMNSHKKATMLKESD